MEITSSAAYRPATAVDEEDLARLIGPSAVGACLLETLRLSQGRNMA